MGSLITKVIGNDGSWFVVSYDPDYPAESTEIHKNLNSAIGDYPTKQEAEENFPEHRGVSN